MTVHRIRTGEPDDLPRLGAIERDAAQVFREIGYGFCAEGPVRDAAELARAMDDGAVLVAEAPGGGLAGFALLWRLDGEAHLLELSVARTHQGHGLGRRLVAAAEDWARAQGFAGLTLTTFRDVAWNAPLYERLGFHSFDPEPGREGLAAVQAEEAKAGYAARPRVAMRKALPPAAG